MAKEKIQGNVTTAIGSNLLALRNAYGLTQEQLAKIAGVSKKSISAWENHRLNPSFARIRKISEHFNIGEGDLLNERGLFFARDPNNYNNFVLGVGQPPRTHPGLVLSVIETNMFEDYRKLSDYQKYAVRSLIETLVRSNREMREAMIAELKRTGQLPVQRVYRPTVPVTVSDEEAKNLDPATRTRITDQFAQKLAKEAAVKSLEKERKSGDGK